MSLIVVPRGSRSHLATKDILVQLGQEFGVADFTSRLVSFRLRLDFLYACKELSRMAKRPDYYLRVVKRVPRSVGGFGNVYVISPRGWSKINYYRAHDAPPAPEIGKTLWDSMWDTGFLLYGKGSLSDTIAMPALKSLGRDLRMPALPLDDLGRVLVAIDENRIPAEAFLANSPFGEKFMTLNRALYLQKIDLIPNNVNIPLYLLHNRSRGISDTTSLITLLIRGGIELRNAAGRSQTSTSEADHQDLLAETKRKIVEKENNLLRNKLANTRLEKFKLVLRNDNLCDNLLDTSRLVNTISENMKKLGNPYFDASAIKLIVQMGLEGIADVNYFTFTRNKSNA